MVFHMCVLKWLDAIHGTNDNNWSKWFGVNRLGSSDLIHERSQTSGYVGLPSGNLT